MRILIALLLTLAGLVAAAPNTSAVAICSTQNDVQDLDLDDSWLVRSQCTTENVISYDCDTDVQVYADGTVYRSTRCDPLIYCVTDPCPGPYTASADPLALLPCDTDANPTDDDGVSTTCSTPLTTCSVAALWYGAWLAQPPVAGGCSKPDLSPPYDCVQDCDGPPTE